MSSPEPMPTKSQGEAAGPAPAPGRPAEPYTAVIHFHGIGQQRHYESVSQLVEALHDWVHGNFRRGDTFFVQRAFRGLWRLKVKREPARTEGGKKQGPERVVYVQASAPPALGEKHNVRVRFYEAYWAPETVKGTTAAAVGWWLVKQAWRPLQLLLTRWGKYDRIRIADLAGMHQRLRLAGADAARLKAVESVAESYRAFADRQGNGVGGIGAFLRQLDPGLRPVALEWYTTFRGKQIVHLLTIILVLCAVGAAFGLVLLALAWLLRQAVGDPRLALWLPGIAEKLNPTWENMLTLIPVVLAALGINRFLRDHVGDVQQFVSYEETEVLYERRCRVLAAAVRAG